MLRYIRVSVQTFTLAIILTIIQFHPALANEYDIPIIIAGETFTVTVNVVNNEIVSATSAVAGVQIGEIQSKTTLQQTEFETMVEVSEIIHELKNYDEIPRISIDFTITNLTENFLSLYHVVVNLYDDKGKLIKSIECTSKTDVEPYGVSEPCHALLFRTTKKQFEVIASAKVEVDVQTGLEQEIEAEQESSDLGTDSTVQSTETAKSFLTFSGNGDDIVEVSDLDANSVFVAHIVGNTDSKYFGMILHDGNGERLDTLVNTTDMYNGIVPLNFDIGFQATIPTNFMLEVKATGPWTIEILPADRLRLFTKGVNYTGYGDEVVIVDKSSRTANITGNVDARYFGVKVINGRGISSVINTTDPYTGKVLLGNEPLALIIKSSGEWSITLE